MPGQNDGERWKAFGWNVITIDGHDHASILASIDSARLHSGEPTVILARTIKGKGVSFMEDDNSWHQRAPSEEELEIARIELGTGH
jgi:transketolase